MISSDSSILSIPSIPLPMLHHRKDIWEQFPVNLVPLGRGDDGAERHAIEWNRKKLLEARESLPEDAWWTFESSLERHLLVALRSSPHWSVEPAQNNKQLCIIRMAFSTKAQKKGRTDVKTERSITPLLTCLNDIKRFFPVVWHSLDDADGKKRYSIELHHAGVQTMTNALGYNAEKSIETLLLTALNASTSWTVETAELCGEVCRIRMV